jgi:hypothetical protein
MAAVNNNAIECFSDLYLEMVSVSKETRKGGASIPHVWITKKQCKALAIDWGIVEKSAQILGLEIVRSARIGFSIQKPLAA